MPCCSSERIVLLDDPDNDPKGNAMDFRLTYDGPLWAATSDNPRAKHKHDIRRRFHPQLKRLWQINPNLQEWEEHDPVTDASVPASDALATRFSRIGYRFVPLVTEDHRLICSIDILFIRPEAPGSLIRSGDLDNRLKVLFDSLRLPADLKELGGYHTPGPDEDPFFCLLQDDKLITHLSISTDMLLEPINGKSEIDPNDVRLVIAVNVRPTVASFTSLNFI